MRFSISSQFFEKSLHNNYVRKINHKKNRNEEFEMKKLTKKQIKKMIKEKEYRELRKLIPPECVCEQCKIKYGYK